MTDEQAVKKVRELVAGLNIPNPVEGHRRVTLLHLDRKTVAGQIQGTIGSVELGGEKGINIRDNWGTHPIGEGLAYTVLDIVDHGEEEKVDTALHSINIPAVIHVKFG